MQGNLKACCKLLSASLAIVLQKLCSARGNTQPRESLMNLQGLCKSSGGP